MAIVINHVQRLWGSVGTLAHQLYNARLMKAEREVKRHRSFLDR